jgi:hypothetical protein
MTVSEKALCPLTFLAESHLSDGRTDGRRRDIAGIRAALLAGVGDQVVPEQSLDLMSGLFAMHNARILTGPSGRSSLSHRIFSVQFRLGKRDATLSATSEVLFGAGYVVGGNTTVIRVQQPWTRCRGCEGNCICAIGLGV